MKKFAAIFVLSMLSGCATFMVAPYQPSDETKAALESGGLESFQIDSLSSYTNFDTSCKGNAGKIELPNRMSYEEYLRRSIIEEFSRAGLYDTNQPKFKLSIVIEEIAFKIFHGDALSLWDIELQIRSSNGHFLHLSHHYLFKAGVYGNNDCKKIADTFMPAVQGTILKLANSPDLKLLLTP